MTEKTLDNTDMETATVNVSDIKVFGNPGQWRLLCKASSESEGWMKSTKVLNIPEIGCVMQVTTQQRNLDGTYSIAEALTYIPKARIVEILEGYPEMRWI